MMMLSLYYQELVAIDKKYYPQTNKIIKPIELIKPNNLPEKVIHHHTIAHYQHNVNEVF